MEKSFQKGPIVGFDLGGTKMLALVLNGSNEVRGRERKKTKAQDESGLSVDRIIRTIRTALETAQLGDPSGIGLAVPGALNLETGMVIDAPNLGWHNIAFQSIIEKEFKCKVRVINDVDAGVYGEYRMGVAQKARCVAGIFPGTGIGGGCVYNGELIRGKTQSCMELGHIQMVVDGLQCGCGKRGCLETIASRLAISAAAVIAVYRGEAPNLERIAGTDISNIRSGALADAIKAGDKAIEQIVKRSAQWIGIAAATVINLLAPDLIVLGGGLVEAMPDLYKSEVEKAARNAVMPAFQSTFSVAVAKLGDDATALGAASWIQHVLEVSSART